MNVSVSRVAVHIAKDGCDSDLKEVLRRMSCKVVPTDQGFEGGGHAARDKNPINVYSTNPLV